MRNGLGRFCDAMTIDFGIAALVGARLAGYNPRHSAHSHRRMDVVQEDIPLWQQKYGLTNSTRRPKEVWWPRQTLYRLWRTVIDSPAANSNNATMPCRTSRRQN